MVQGEKCGGCQSEHLKEVNRCHKANSFHLLPSSITNFKNLMSLLYVTITISTETSEV